MIWKNEWKWKLILTTHLLLPISSRFGVVGSQLSYFYAPGLLMLPFCICAHILKSLRILGRWISGSTEVDDKSQGPNSSLHFVCQRWFAFIIQLQTKLLAYLYLSDYPDDKRAIKIAPSYSVYFVSHSLNLFLLSVIKCILKWGEKQFQLELAALKCVFWPRSSL